MQPIANKLREKIDRVVEQGLSTGRTIDAELPAPVNLSIVQELESKHSIQLPADYVEFVTTFANGGFGPGHGLLSVQESFQCFEELQHSVVDAKIISLEEPFPIVPIDWLRASILELPLKSEFPVNGVLPICQWENFEVIGLMVVSGEYRGTICYVSPTQPGHGDWTLDLNPERQQFICWYEHWLSSLVAAPTRAAWRKDQGTSKLKWIKAGLGLGEKSLSRSSLLELLHHMPREIELYLKSVDSILDTPLNRNEIKRLFTDIKHDDVQLEAYLFYQGQLGEVFARPNAVGNELMIDIYGQFSEPCNTKDRSTMREKIIDITTAFGSAYLFNMEDGVDSEFLFRVKTTDIVDWEKIDERIKLENHDTSSTD